MDRKKLTEKLDYSIRNSHSISGDYSAGCMNVAVAVHEICVEQSGYEPSVIALERPFSLQSTIDHFVLAFGKFSVGEVRNIDYFSDSENTIYLDTKGSFKDIRSILQILYVKDEIEKVGIFRSSIEEVKQSPYYDKNVKNKFKEDIEQNRTYNILRPIRPRQ